ncbi:MAG: dihydroorotate dehydrogenase electron transfer subunit, partial [Bacteroidales bacterium]
VQKVGDGSIQLSSCPENSKINLIYPLGKGFTMPNLELASLDTSILLVGGGCGIAPLLYLAKNLKENGIKTSVLLGARSRDQLICQETLSSYASLYPCTEDGSVGFKGLVTEHPLWKTESFSHIYTCGPTPMMKAVAALSVKMGSKHCQVSLENTMACGLGACLCCVTPSAQGHNLCVCTDGPVFDASVLGW